MSGLQIYREINKQVFSIIVLFFSENLNIPWHPCEFTVAYQGHWEHCLRTMTLQGFRASHLNLISSFSVCVCVCIKNNNKKYYCCHFTSCEKLCNKYQMTPSAATLKLCNDAQSSHKQCYDIFKISYYHIIFKIINMSGCQEPSTTIHFFLQMYLRQISSK